MSIVFFMHGNEFSGVVGILIILWLLIMMAVWIWAIRWNIKTTVESKRRLAQWASEGGWQIVLCVRKYRPGPFGWIPGKATIYLRFVAQNQYGKKQVGWASFDHSLFAKGRMDVRWSDS